MPKTATTKALAAAGTPGPAAHAAKGQADDGPPQPDPASLGSHPLASIFSPMSGEE
jgi:hypothetical protein